MKNGGATGFGRRPVSYQCSSPHSVLVWTSAVSLRSDEGGLRRTFGKGQVDSWTGSNVERNRIGWHALNRHGGAEWGRHRGANATCGQRTAFSARVMIGRHPIVGLAGVYCCRVLVVAAMSRNHRNMVVSGGFDRRCCTRSNRRTRQLCRSRALKWHCDQHQPHQQGSKKSVHGKDFNIQLRG
jgi:hypothetical protein